MDENIPHDGSKPTQDTINDLRFQMGAGGIKSEKSWLRMIGGLLLLIILLAMFFGFQQYLLSQRFSELTANLTELEVRVQGLEKQQAELQKKSSDTGIRNEVEILSSKVSSLEKQVTAPQRKSPSDSPKQAKAVKKRYHEVRKGETLYRISKQYGLTVDELRRLNKLSPNQPIEVGQKLLISK